VGHELSKFKEPTSFICGCPGGAKPALSFVSSVRPTTTTHKHSKLPLVSKRMATHKGHFKWYNEEEVYGKKQWTRVYFVLKIEERALYIYKQKKVPPTCPHTNYERHPFPSQRRPQKLGHYQSH
jgi:hypothetical protein